MHSSIQRCMLGARYSAHGLQWFCRHLLWCFIAFALVGVPILYSNGVIEIETVNKLGRFLCFAIVALSLDLIWGYGGMLCLCQFLFFSLGGYAMGMYLAHHGGPEGIIDAAGWGKVPACLYVVYPYAVGEVPGDAVVPWFWKPFWSLGWTIVLGLLIPGLVAAAIGYTVFRSRVRGVFFAVLTQALALAFWLVFSMNNMMLCGTNGLTRFDRIVVGNKEQIRVAVSNNKISRTSLSAEDIFDSVSAWCNATEGAAFVSVSDNEVVAVLDKSLHVWNASKDIARTPVRGESAVTIGDVSEVGIVGFKLTDSAVKLWLYILTAIALILAFFFCRLLIQSRLGRVLIAIRDNESRLRFSGYQPYAFKTLVFAISAAIAGLGGMLYTPQMGIFTPTNLEPKESILVVVWVAVGGRGSLAGAILGALAVSYGYDYLTSTAPDAWPFVLGGLVVAVTRLQGGLIGIWNSWLDCDLLSETKIMEREQKATALGNDVLPGRWDLSLKAFAFASILVSAVFAFCFLKDGGPFERGLMAEGDSDRVVTGLLLSIVGFCSLLQLPASVGLLQRKRWAADLSRSLLLGMLVALLGLFSWLFARHSLSRGLGVWLAAGGNDSLETLKSFPLIAGVVGWAGIGLAITYFTPRLWWQDEAQDDREEALKDDEVKMVHRVTPRNAPQLTGQCGTVSPQLLQVNDLKVVFEGFKALDIDEFSVCENELNVIIGPNGAGKTTLCDVISGKTRASEGSVVFDGREITAMTDVQIARLGVGRKFQTPTVFDSLTVFENMELAISGRTELWRNFRLASSADEKLKIIEILERAGLVDLLGKEVGYLSHGQRQWLEISMLALAAPKLLLVDEPAAGLSDQETAMTAELLAELSRNQSVIVIEHDMEFVQQLASPVTVLIDGKIEDRGTIAEIHANETIREAYLGR